MQTQHNLNKNGMTVSDMINNVKLNSVKYANYFIFFNLIDGCVKYSNTTLMNINQPKFVNVTNVFYKNCSIIDKNFNDSFLNNINVENLEFSEAIEKSILTCYLKNNLY